MHKRTYTSVECPPVEYPTLAVEEHVFLLHLSWGKCQWFWSVGKVTTSINSMTWWLFADALKTWSQIRQEYPLNLSILISGGKETNRDSLSNGEWTGNSSNLKSLRRIVVCRGVFVDALDSSPLERGITEGDNPVSDPVSVTYETLLRVGLLGTAAQSGWYIPSKAKYWRETDSKQVPWGKDEKNFEKRVKSTWNC